MVLCSSVAKNCSLNGNNLQTKVCWINFYLKKFPKKFEITQFLTGSFKNSQMEFVDFDSEFRLYFDFITFFKIQF
jgi:hypothetical protein